jgi:hypothetical protein
MARDAIHVAVGLGVLGLQRAQMRRQELTKRLAGPKSRAGGCSAGVREKIASKMHEADGAVEALIVRAEASLEALEDRLPSPARDMAKQVHARSREARALMRSIVRRYAA